MVKIMIKNDELEDQKLRAESWFMILRDQICKKFEEIENGAKFQQKPWDREGGGGGVISLMRGNVFEKVGVNVSTVHGIFAEKFRKEIPGAEENPEFFATGISLVAHMKSPLVPAVHMNTRFIVTGKSWFGGGADLTPMYPDDEDTKDFHHELKKACDKHDDS